MTAPAVNQQQEQGISILTAGRNMERNTRQDRPVKKVEAFSAANIEKLKLYNLDSSRVNSDDRLLKSSALRGTSGMQPEIMLFNSSIHTSHMVRSGDEEDAAGHLTSRVFQERRADPRRTVQPLFFQR